MRNAHITVLGARGSIPVSGDRFAKYGGNTSCFALVVDDLTVAFFDAGTGIMDARHHGAELAPSIDVLLTHYHWDHTQGLSMLKELWSGDTHVCIRGPGDPAPILERAISPPLFPVSIGDVATVTFASTDQPVEIAGMLVTSFAVSHPQGASGFRIDGPDRSIAIVTDHEGGSAADSGVVAAIAGVDVVIHDAQYLPEEMEQRQGWGHSSYEHAVEAVRMAGADELVLTSHDPGRSDAEVDAIVTRARTLFPHADAAVPGMRLSL